MTNLQVAFQTARPATAPSVEVILAAAQTFKTVTPQTLWACVAEESCPAWTVAQKALATVEEALDRLHSDEHRPLGAIGAALDAPELETLKEEHATALAVFTVVDEALRAHPQIAQLYEAARLALCPGVAPKSAPVSAAPAVLSWGRRALQALRA